MLHSFVIRDITVGVMNEFFPVGSERKYVFVAFAVSFPLACVVGVGVDVEKLLNNTKKTEEQQWL
jgi:heme exporter protein D